MTTIPVAPPRQPVLLAEQVATLSRVSGGRFRLGLGLGPRDDDWRAPGVEPADRGKRLDDVIDTCRALGDDAWDEADRNAASYCGFAGDEMVQMISQSILRTADQVRETQEALEQHGCEELCLWPMAADGSQVDRLAEAALS